jgi:arginase family enzyme
MVIRYITLAVPALPRAAAGGHSFNKKGQVLFEMTFASFGCALDVLDAPDKLALKLAYLDALREGRVQADIARDPYDLLQAALDGAAGLVTVGKLELEAWMTPRPALAAAGEVVVPLYREFLDTGGCAIVSARVREFVRERVLPLTPFMIGVDHSLTGGVLDAICGPDPEEMALVVLDSHFDAIPSQVRRAAAAEAGAAEPRGDEEPEPESYNCGTWVAGVIERELVAPSNIVVIGPSDRPADAGEAEGRAMAAFRDTYAAFESDGVRVIGKQRVREVGAAEAAREAVQGLNARSIYLSVDADIGAGEQVKAVRFLDTIGLEPREVVRLCGSIAVEAAARGVELAGFDVMEIDVHLADIPGSGDRTIEMCAAAAREIMAGSTAG